MTLQAPATGAAAPGLAGLARAALGAAVTYLGPEAVLAALPLDLDNVRSPALSASLPGLQL